MTHTKDVIDEMLDGASGTTSEYTSPDLHLPTTIHISPLALEKAGTICDLIEESHGSKYEWHGFLVSKRGSRAVHDILIGKQRCSGHSHHIEGEEVARLVDQVSPDSWIVGWILRYGYHPLFFSSIDIRNMEALVHSVHANTEIPLSTNGSQPAFVGWSYSIAVNGTRDVKGMVQSKGMITYREFAPLQNKVRIWSHGAEVILSTDGYGDVPHHTAPVHYRQNLREEVRQKILIEGHDPYNAKKT